MFCSFNKCARYEGSNLRKTLTTIVSTFSLLKLTLIFSSFIILIIYLLNILFGLFKISSNFNSRLFNLSLLFNSSLKYFK